MSTVSRGWSPWMTGRARVFDAREGVRMTIPKRMIISMAALTGVMALIASSAPASNTATQHASFSQKAALAQVSECPTSYYRTAFTRGPVFGWERYNVNPYYPNVTDLSAYRHFVASAKGQAAAGRLGIPYGLLKQATPCVGWLVRGEHLDKMLSGGFWNSMVKLDLNVKVDFIGTGTGLGKQNGPVRAWYTPVRIGNTIYVFVVPFKCGNAGEIIKHTSAPPVKVKVVQPVPVLPAPLGSCNITISGNNIVINGIVSACSSFTTTIVCSNISQTFTGTNSDDVQKQATDWKQANCSPAPTTTTTSSPPPPPPPPNPCSANPRPKSCDPPPPLQPGG